MPSGQYVRTKFKPIKERLFAKVVKTSTCWLWTGSVGGIGHGQIQQDRNKHATRALVQTHRVSWEIYNGPIPEGLCILHKCDVPNCVNPDHLFLGTKQDNHDDMVSKNRDKKGQQLPQAKLTEDNVRTIRLLDDTQETIAKRFNVNPATISLIKNHKRWKHVI